MRLAAIYIKEHFLFDKPQTINFGGKNIYSFVTVDGKPDEIEITKTENPDFIDGFWGENISLVSAIVGANGAGKTSLLDILKFDYEKILISIYENIDSHEIFYDNKTWRGIVFHHPEEILGTEEQIPHTRLSFTKNIAVINVANLITNFEASKKRIAFENIFSFNPTGIDFEIDSKIKTKEKQFAEQLDFLSNSQLIDVLSKTFDGNINFYKRIKIKPIDFKNYLSKADELIHNRIETKYKESISSFIFNSLSFKSDISDFQKINTLILSKIILFKFESFYNSNKDCADLYLEFNKWLTIDKKVNLTQYNAESFVELIEEILSYKSENIHKDVYDEFLLFYNFIKENLEYDITKDKINDIIKINENHNNFNKLIKNKVDMNFYNDFLDFESITPISQGEEYLIKLFSNLYNVKDKHYQFIFLDEADLGFHPYWKKKFVNAIVQAIPIIFEHSKKKPIQIIFTTHDPLTLSDIPNSNVVYLNKKGDKTIVLEEKERPQKSFGANITDLLADSFFIKDGLIGDFAKGKINDVLRDLLSKKKISKERENEIVKTIYIIDEPIIKMKLHDLFEHKFDKVLDKESRIKFLQDEIKKLQK